MAKNNLRYMLLVAVILFACYGTGYWRGSKAGRQHDSADPKGTERYENISDSAQGIAADVSGRISDAADEVRRAGEAIDGSLVELGQIRQSADSITAGLDTAAAAAGRIEDGIQRIERILQEAETAEGRADCGGNH